MYFLTYSCFHQQKVKKCGEPTIKWHCLPKRNLWLKSSTIYPPIPFKHSKPHQILCLKSTRTNLIMTLPMFKSVGERWSDSETWKAHESKRCMHMYILVHVNICKSSWDNTEPWSCVIHQEMYPEMMITNVQGNRLWIIFILLAVKYESVQSNEIQ